MRSLIRVMFKSISCLGQSVGSYSMAPEFAARTDVCLSLGSFLCLTGATSRCHILGSLLILLSAAAIGPSSCAVQQPLKLCVRGRIAVFRQIGDRCIEPIKSHRQPLPFVLQQL